MLSITEREREREEARAELIETSVGLVFITENVHFR